MKMKFILLTLALSISATSAFAGNKFTVVTENTVDVSNLFTHPDLQKVRPGDSGVPEILAHIYTLRATYTIESTEATGIIQKIPAGCDGMDGAVSCWDDHWQGTLDLRNAGNIARWDLIDQTSGKTLATRTAQMDIDPVRVATKTLNERLEFAGTQYMGPPRFKSQPDQEYFLDKGRKYSLYFSEMFLDAIYRSAGLVVEARGDNRYALAGIQYGGQTNTGMQIAVVPGALFPNAGVWLTRLRHQHPFFGK
ncbi:MAG: hypothetical protein ACXVBL_13065 [Bdellovibrionota bacterium]